MERFFRLKEHGTTVSREILCGITTFLTMSYILFVNPDILAACGMPRSGAFVATSLTAALGTMLLGLVARVPLAMAPGMGLNTFFAYTVCAALGFHWREALAISLMTGLLHVLIMVSGLRKSLVNALPQHLKMAFGVGLGLFIAYVGLKNTGFLVFTTPPGQALILDNGSIISNSSAVPGLVSVLEPSHVLALIGLGVMVFFLALEQKTGDHYAALPVGIISATFVGIPLGVTDLTGVSFIDLAVIGEIREVFFSFWGRPGLMSLFDDPQRLGLAALMVLALLLINVTDSIGTLIGVGQIQGAEVFDPQDMKAFHSYGASSKLDRTLVVNSVGGPIAAVMGTSISTTYIESITGLVSGGRTGLTAVVTALMFLICLPLANFFSLIPSVAIAPALIVAGAFMMPLAARIDWRNFEESFPAFMTIAFIPFSYGFVHGIAAGVLSHVLIQAAVGRCRAVHPLLYIMALVFALVLAMEAFGR